MSFMSTAAAMATAETATRRELPMPTWAYGALALTSFIVLLGVLWFFRNTAAKFDKPDHGTHH